MSDGGNDKAYIHELIDIRGTNRANYMHHMTANWSPNAQEDRNQLCFGVWAVVGSTGPWPQVVNIWEEDGLDGLAASFDQELVGPGLQDPKLERWWQRAADFRRGGFDRILLPAPWMPTVTEAIDAGVRASVFAHEILTCRPGTAPDLLELVGERAAPAYAPFGWRPVGAWSTAMRDDDEAIVVWAIDDISRWAAAEQAQRSDGGLLGWRRAARSHVTGWERTLLAASPLNPLTIGRQPARSDRTDWVE